MTPGQRRVFGYRVIKSEMRKERNLTIPQEKPYVNLMENSREWEGNSRHFWLPDLSEWKQGREDQ